MFLDTIGPFRSLWQVRLNIVNKIDLFSNQCAVDPSRIGVSGLTGQGTVTTFSWNRLISSFKGQIVKTQSVYFFNYFQNLQHNCQLSFLVTRYIFFFFWYLPIYFYTKNNLLIRCLLVTIANSNPANVIFGKSQSFFWIS